MTRMVARVLPTPVRYSAPYEYILVEEATGAELGLEESTSGMTNTAGAQLSCDRSVTSPLPTVARWRKFQSWRESNLVMSSRDS